MAPDVITFAWPLGVLGLAAAWQQYRGVLAHPAGSERMQALAGEIRDGAMAYLRRQSLVVLPVLAIVATLLGWAISWRTGIAYALGGA